MTDILKIDVQTGDTARKIQEVSAAYRGLDGAVVKFAGAAPRALAEVEKALVNTTGAQLQLLTKQKTALTALASPEGYKSHAAIDMIESVNQTLKKAFADRLLTAGKLSNAELQVWKNHGVALKGIQAAQLKGFEVGQLERNLEIQTKNIDIALAKQVEVVRRRKAELENTLSGASGFAADRYNYARAIGSKEVFSDALPIAAKLNMQGLQRSPLDGFRESTKANADATVAEAKSMYSRLRIEGEEFSRKSLAELKAYYIQQGAVSKFAYASTATVPEIVAAKNADATTRAMASSAFSARSKIIAEESRKAAEAFAASPSVLADMQKYYKTEEVIAAVAAKNANATTRAMARSAFSARSKIIAEERSRLTGDNSEAMRLLRSQYAPDGDRFAQAEMEKARSSTEKLTGANKQLTGANKSLSTSYRQLLIDGNDVHSLNRGLASSFGLLWLTWGNLLPLFAGAAISSSIKNVVTLGAEVQHTMETIRVLSGETETAVAGLNEQLLSMARNGPQGPQELANAMKTLSLAGLSAGEVSASIQDVVNFAIAGTTDMKTAADVMTSVATAFGITAHGYNYVGDVISKTAAISKSSVESIGEAFKTASVLHKQYGASLEDVGLGLAALSNLGIQGSAAGTALRNMYVDLSGRTPQVRKAMSDLGLELTDTNGRFLDLVTMAERTKAALDALSGEARKNALRTLLSERGGKPVVELMDLADRRSKAFNTDGTTELRRLRSEAENAAGFMVEAAVKLALTPQQQLKSIGSSLQATFAETFAGMEPQILGFSKDLRDMFNSPEFKEGLKTLATGALEFGRALASVTSTAVEHAKVVAIVAGTYTTARVGLIAYSAYLSYSTTKKEADTAATLANTAAEVVNSRAKTAGLAGILRFVPGVGTAVTIAGLAWVAYETYVNSAKNAEQGYVNSGYGASIIEKLKQETTRLNDLNEAKLLGMSLDELQARKAVQTGKLESTAAKVAAQQKVEEAKARLKAEESQSGGGRKLVLKELRDSLALKENQLSVAVDFEKQQKREIDNQLELARAAAEKQKQLNKPVLPKVMGTKGFDLPEDGAGGAGKTDRRMSDLDAIIKREEEQAAALAEVKLVTSEYDKATQELAKNTAGLGMTYAKIIKDNPTMTEQEKLKLYLAKEHAAQLIQQNAETQTEIELAKQKHEADIRNLQTLQETLDATEALSRARALAQRESAMGVDQQQARQEFEQSIKYKPSAVQAAEKAAYDIRQQYAKKNVELNQSMSDVTLLTPDREARENEYQQAKKRLQEEEARATGVSTATIYQQAWDQTTSTIASNFTSKLMNGTLDLKEFMIETFASMVLQPQLNLMAQKGFDALLGGSGGWFSMLMGAATGGAGGAFAAATGLGDVMAYEGGGYTGSGPRSGGLDGKGGFMAMVHPNETIIDHTKGGETQASSAPVYITINNTVGDVATKSMLDQANAATVKQIQAGMARSARYNGAMARG